MLPAKCKLHCVIELLLTGKFAVRRGIRLKRKRRGDPVPILTERIG